MLYANKQKWGPVESRIFPENSKTFKDIKRVRTQGSCNILTDHDSQKFALLAFRQHRNIGAKGWLGYSRPERSPLSFPTAFDCALFAFVARRRRSMDGISSKFLERLLPYGSVNLLERDVFENYQFFVRQSLPKTIGSTCFWNFYRVRCNEDCTNTTTYEDSERFEIFTKLLFTVDMTHVWIFSETLLGRVFTFAYLTI